jgi:hypothetical protein
MVDRSGGVFECSGDVSVLEQRVVSENFLPAGARSQQIKHVLDLDAQASQARAAAALVRIDGDSAHFAHGFFFDAIRCKST